MHQFRKMDRQSISNTNVPISISTSTIAHLHKYPVFEGGGRGQAWLCQGYGVGEQLPSQYGLHIVSHDLLLLDTTVVLY